VAELRSRHRILAALLAASKFGVRHPLAFALLGVCMWIAMFFSGVHATIAGVLAAFAVPARSRIDMGKFIARGRQLLDQMEYPDRGVVHILRSETRQVAVLALEDACVQDVLFHRPISPRFSATSRAA
jgi:Na+:H+ antiporter, NhaA family